MKKYLCLLIIAVFSSAMISGCNKIGNENSSSSLSSNESAEENSGEKSTDKTVSEIPKIDSDTEHVFDYSGSLSDDQRHELNDYAAGTVKKYKVQTAIVITDSLEEKKPEDFAQQYYNDLYDSSPGLLYLINNETGADVIYRLGAPCIAFSGSEINMLFTKTSPLLVTGNTYDAAKLFLEEAATQLPEFILDRTGILNEQQMKEIDDKLRNAFDGKNICMVLMKNLEDKTKENYRNFFKTVFDEKSDCAMLYIDPENGINHLEVSGAYEKLKDIEEFSDKISSYYNEEAEENKYDTGSAADSFIELMGQ